MENFKLKLEIDDEKIEAYLLVHPNKFNTLKEYLEAMDINTRITWANIIRDQHHIVDTTNILANILATNATYIYFKEMDIKTPLLGDDMLNKITHLFCNAIMHYHLHIDGQIIQKDEDIFNSLYRLVSTAEKNPFIQEVNIKHLQPRKVYLAIPYSGMEESSYFQATYITGHLMSTIQKINVFSPITHGHTISKNHSLPKDFDYWMDIDFQYLDWADEIIIIIPKEGPERIQNSKGVQAELRYAISKGKSVRFLAFVGEEIQFIDPSEEDFENLEDILKDLNINTNE